LLGILVVLPAIVKPAIGIACVAGLIALWLASKSVAYPLAAAFVPSLVDAIYGSNPLPPGGVTFLFAAWIGLAIVIAMVRGNQPRGLLSVPVMLAFALMALMVVRLGPSIAESYGSKKLQLYIANNLVFLIAGVFVGARRRDARQFYMIMLAISAAGALLLVVALATGQAQQVVANRFTVSTQEYPIQLARSSADGMLLAIYVMIAARTLGARLWAAAVFPALAVTLIAAGSRGPVLAFLFAVIALLALAAATGRARRQLTRVAATILGAVVLVPLLVPGSTIGRALSAIVGGASGLSTNGRAGLWAKAISEFSTHPLLGIGTGGFAGLKAGELYPHNVLLEAAVELGILGGIVAAWFIVSSLRRMIAFWRSSVGADKLEASLIISLFLAALINALFSGAFQDNREVWLWAGFGIGMCARNVILREDPSVPRPITARAHGFGERPGLVRRTI
jgi:O-antigen ligase